MTETKNGKWLSTKPIPVEERLIFALDTSDTDDAKRLVDELGDEVRFYKLGLELFVGGGYFELLDWLSRRGKKLFVDLKFFDVPQTVASAVRQLRGRHASFATVHGNDEIVRAACAEKHDIKILAVTVLTSLNRADIEEFGYRDLDVRDLVLSRARRGLKAGADGVISSGLEAEALREELGERFLIVVPGIRPVANVDDQKANRRRRTGVPIRRRLHRGRQTDQGGAGSRSSGPRYPEPHSPVVHPVVLTSRAPPPHAARRTSSASAPPTDSVAYMRCKSAGSSTRSGADHRSEDLAAMVRWPLAYEASHTETHLD